MDKIIDTSEYGICLFSLEKMTDFLKDNKVKSSKVLITFQKKDKLYIKSQEEGIWTPISQIGVSKVIIKIAGFDDEFSSDWNKILNIVALILLLKMDCGLQILVFFLLLMKLLLLVKELRLLLVWE